MAVTNLTTTYADKIDEKFTPTTVTDAGVNQSYTFDGSQTIKVTSVTTGSMADYNRTQGFGTPETLSNALQTLTLTQDRSFSILLDKMDEEESKVKAGEVLARQLTEVVKPEIEAYRLKAMIKATPSANAITYNLSTQKAYDVFLAANEKLDDGFVPQVGRVAFVSPRFYNLIKKDESFIKQSELSQQMLVTGQVGEIDGVALIKTNKAWLTDGSKLYDCLFANKIATVAPLKLMDFRMNTTPDRFSGTLFDGRFIYDAFVLTNKAGALATIGEVKSAPKK